MSRVDGNRLYRALTHRTDRRRLMKGAAAGAAVAGIPSIMRPGHTVAQNATLNILAPAWPQWAIEQELATDLFTAETGIAVVIEASQYAFLEQQIKQLVQAESSEFDIYHYDSQWIGWMSQTSKTLERLDTPTYLGSADSAVSFDDFFPELSYRLAKYPTNEIEIAQGNFEPYADTPIYGLPWSLNSEALWYRTDLISTPPTTWEEVREMAKTLTKDGMYGWAWQGSRDSDWITHDFVPVMYSYGGALWDPNTYTAEGYVNSPDSIAALQFMHDMVAVDKSVDPASGNWTINERLAALLQGKTAMAFNWVALFGGIADDPASTPFAGKFGYAVVPKGPKGQGAAYGCQGTGINSFSTQKEIAWQYIQWLTSQETQLAMVERPEACFISGRKDLVEAAQYPWQQALLDLIPYVRDIWNIPEYASLLNVLQTELNLAYVGRKPADEALNDAALAHQAIYDTIVEQGGAEGQG